MPDIITVVAAQPIAHNFARLDLWPFRQGDSPQFLPLSLDIEFDAEQVRTPNNNFTVYARKATLELSLEGLKIVRGSKYGGDIHAPYVLSEIKETVRRVLETESTTEFTGEVQMEWNFLGRLSAIFKRRRTKRKTEEGDATVQLAVKVRRITSRIGNRWTFAEPIAPNLLNGQYLGQSYEMEGETAETPICALMMESQRGRLCAYLFVDRSDLKIVNDAPSLTKNKECIVNALVSRSVPNSVLSRQNLPVNADSRICLNFSEAVVSYGD